MENITLGQIAAGFGIIVAILGGYKVLYDKIDDVIKKIVKESLEPIDESVVRINLRLDAIDMQACKNYLVRCIGDIEREDKLTETETERFWEQYDDYIASGGNTYVKNRVTDLRREGKI